MAWADTNMDLSANYWDGSTWQSEPAAVLAADLSEVGTGNILTNWSFDLEFESTSGELLVVWGLDATADPRYVTRGAGAAGAWGSITTATALFEEPTDLDLSGDPGSDYIAYINSTDNGGDSDAAMWTGSAWANANNFDTTNDTLAAGTSNNAIGWVTSGTQVRAVGTYDDANGAGLDWLVFDKNAGTWTLQTDCTTACNSQPASGDDKIHRIRMNPFDESQLTWVGVDTNSDLFAKRLSFDGTNLTWSSHEPSSATLEATVSSITGISIDFAYNRTLSPIVDQLHYRWRSDDGNETTGTSLQNEDTAHTGLAKSTNIRLRFTVNNTGGSATNYNYRLEWAAASGACDGTGETFAAVPDTATTEPFDMTTTTNYADQAASTNAASGPGVLTDPGGSTFAAGYLLESPSNQTPNLTLAQNIFTELEYNFQANTNATDSTTYCFRLSNAGTGLNTYTRYAEVTTAAPPGPTTDQVLRHGNWWSGGAEQSFFWAQ
ncbi:MAG TPA: hypothetical protein VFK94_02430, partial [Patescibacteria group bacterium]|nr:hypothetical protein [Patescibacteria group bacterium]